DAQLVEGAAQVVLDDLLGRADDPADFAIGQALPDQDGDLNLFVGKALPGHHDCAPSRLYIAMASFTRLRPSRMPARRNSVRKCCLTVRGLIFNWPEIGR